jgi:hypothetical protein
MNRISISFFLLFMAVSAFALDFKIEGSRIYWKSEGAKEYDALDYVNVRGAGYLEWKSRDKGAEDGVVTREDCTVHYIFEDKSDIQKVTEDSFHKKLFIEKRKSKWVLDCDNNPPYLYMTEPIIDNEHLERSYIRQIYPTDKSDRMEKKIESPDF